MTTQALERFRVDDALSAWTEKLAELIPYPALQFDNRVAFPASRLYYQTVPSGYVCIHVFTPNVNQIDSGCVVYVKMDNANKVRYESPQLLVNGEDYEQVVEQIGFVEAALPEGFRIAAFDDSPRTHRSGIDDRQLIEMGRLLKELRTNRPM